MAALNSAFRAPNKDDLRLSGWAKETCSGCEAFASKVLAMRDNKWHTDGTVFKLGSPKVSSVDNDELVVEMSCIQDFRILDERNNVIGTNPRQSSKLRFFVEWDKTRWIIKEIQMSE